MWRVLGQRGSWDWREAAAGAASMTLWGRKLFRWSQSSVRWGQWAVVIAVMSGSSCFRIWIEVAVGRGDGGEKFLEAISRPFSGFPGSGPSPGTVGPLRGLLWPWWAIPGRVPGVKVPIPVSREVSAPGGLRVGFGACPGFPGGVWDGLGGRFWGNGRRRPYGGMVGRLCRWGVMPAPAGGGLAVPGARPRWQAVSGNGLPGTPPVGGWWRT